MNHAINRSFYVDKYIRDDYMRFICPHAARQAGSLTPLPPRVRTALNSNILRDGPQCHRIDDRPAT